MFKSAIPIISWLLQFLPRSSSFLGCNSLFGLSLSGGFLLSLLFLDVLRNNLLEGSNLLLGSLPVVDLCLLGSDLSLSSGVSNESLDLWRFVEGLVTSLDFSSDNVLGHIVLLSEHKGLSNVGSSLWAESSWLFSVGKASNLLISLLDDLESNDSKVWSANASSSRLSLSLSRASWSVKRDSYLIIA
jgi:hypothetical protein